MADDIGVIAQTADEPVGASGAAVERVVASTADDDVVERVSGPVDIVPGQRQVFHIGGQGIGHGGSHRVHAAAACRCFVHRIGCAADDVDIVPGAACKAVGSRAAVEGVVARAPT